MFFRYFQRRHKSATCSQQRDARAGGKRRSPFCRLLVEALESRVVPTSSAVATVAGWQLLEQTPPAARVGAQALTQPRHYQALSLDLGQLQAQLQNCPLENTLAGKQHPIEVRLPTPNGAFARFLVVESPIMEPGLAAMFPEIKTYAGQGVDDPTATLRFDLSPYGFHAQVLSPTTGAFYIDPYYHLDNSVFISYFRKDLISFHPSQNDQTTLAELASGQAGRGATASTQSPPIVAAATATAMSSDSDTAQRTTKYAARSGTQLRTYRLAVAATGEYSTFHGGTLPLVQAEIVTAINRVSGIYENEFTTRLVLVASNNLLIYLNAGTDPYTDQLDGPTLLSDNQANIDAVIGDANYDIGHVFSTGGGGLAGLGVVGVTGFKAQGETGSSSPIGDAFYVDYVAHEMGHQFGGNHTFNGVNGALGGNENPGTAYEPGSGSTIMAYAGIAGADDLQANSDPYLHSVSFDEILTFVTTGPGLAAAALSATGNTVPTVSAGLDFTIPTGTPFVLVATGSDANGDTLTYSWEERDLGPQQALASPDNGTSPLFRAYAPTTANARFLPKITDVLTGTADPAEVLPSLARTMNWRVTVRDNRAGGGGINTDDMVVTVFDTGAAFAVTSPNTAVTWAGLSSQTIIWNVAGTSAAPINAANVNIRLSTDGGATFTMLAAATPNDGSQTITVPNIDTTTARIFIEAVGNIFYDVSNVDFTINSVAGGSVTLTPAGPLAVAEGGATATYTIVLSPAPTANVLITLTPNSQVTIAPIGPLTFTPANFATPQTVTVTAANDAIAEGIHGGVVTHTASSGDAVYNGIAINNMTATITDNDSAGVAVTPSGSTDVSEAGGTDTYTIVLTSQPTANVTINLNGGAQLNGAPSNLTFTAANWSTPQTVTVSAIDDAANEGPHTGTIVHAATSADPNYSGIAIIDVTANITDNDTPIGITITPSGTTDVTEGGATDNYTVVLISAPTASVVVTVSPGTQLSGVPATLTFTPITWNNPQTVVVLAIDDAISEGVHSGVITHTSTSADVAYNAIAIASVTATITDNDTPGVNLAPASFALTEGAAGRAVTVVLASQPTANVIVTLSPDTQVVLSSSLLTFTAGNWNVAQTVTATAVDDLLIEGLHTGNVSAAASSADLGYNGLAITGVTATITDNDVPGVTLSATALAVLEGTTGSYTAMLTLPPAADVTITVSSGASTTVAPSSLVFTPGNWNIPQSFVVTAVDDLLVQGNYTDTLTHSVASADLAYSGVTVPSVLVNIFDNDGTLVSGTSGDDKITVTNSTDLANINVNINGIITSFPSTLGQLILDASGGTDTIRLTNPLIPITVLGGQGIDTVTVTGQTAANAFALDVGSLTVNGRIINLSGIETLTASGKGGDDSFTVANTPQFNVNFRGEGGNDSLVGADRGNTWMIPASNAGTLNTSIKFTNVENLTGGGSVDGFYIASSRAVSGIIDGGAGSNALNYAMSSSSITVNLQALTATGMKSFANIDQIIGSKGGSDRLVGLDQTNVWNINAGNGSVGAVTFQNFENLSGGQANDTFLLADNRGLKGKIDGGGGTNILDYTSYLSRAITVNLQTRTATNLGGFINMSQILAGAGKDTLIGSNLVNTWNLTGTNSGDVGSLFFAGFENLSGGVLQDTFTLTAAGSWTGLLAGGSGVDTLNSSAGSVYTPIGPGTGLLNGRKFQSIEVRL